MFTGNKRLMPSLKKPPKKLRNKQFKFSRQQHYFTNFETGQLIFTTGNAQTKFTKFYFD